MPTFKDLNSLFKHIEKKVAESMNDVGKVVAEETKTTINDVVYSQQPKEYERTFQLRDSITNFPARVEGNTVVVEIDHDTSLIISDPDNFTHGSNFYDPKDISEFLDVIVHEGKSGDLFGDGYWRKERRYFDVTVKKLIQSKKHIDALKKSLNKNGIKTM